ncbi:MAG: SDR family oxidoreductase [Acidimicrobiaceae bacterium]|nr:SDR family NAD(P)-dependent oxidoreductase [Acidimicrobiaceae bacterium]MCY3643624.1 SDR family NAD(P)-dependent oxidoreductase [Acidimicrobiaceae bacterium]MDE0656659.1 SDR family NAD(P)-dependent oxidoreductase [Acidimicrobiaceae bacterium]MDE0664690.1 SDR family NAD(P)-dependent oxidoreductase [Acidimicrobiaceae bacterium]MXY12356.1 SDR family oxidoreductase [Acidimicrobiaceae bacterium]
MTETNTGRTATADTFDVSGRRVVITGGTAGIGLAAAAHLVRCGAQVVIGGRRAGGRDIAEGIGAEFVPMDVADEASVATAFEAVAERFEALDALILNAGIDAFHGDVDSLDLEVFERVMDVNTMGVVRAVRHGVNMVRDHGSVIVTSSPAGSVGAPGMAAYGASKAAIDQLVRVWALELGPRHIRVNAVLPGNVQSEMMSESTPDVELIRRLTANDTYRPAPEIAPVFHFLVSDASAPLTGSLVGCHDGIPAGFSLEVMARVAADLPAGDEGLQ